MSGITQVEVSAMMLHNESRELVVEYRLHKVLRSARPPFEWSLTLLRPLHQSYALGQRRRQEIRNCRSPTDTRCFLRHRCPSRSSAILFFSRLSASLFICAANWMKSIIFSPSSVKKKQLGWVHLDIADKPQDQAKTKGPDTCSTQISDPSGRLIKNFV